MSQIETIMLVALGFVGALLVGLLVVRGLWTYAVSLGKRRVERRAPSAIAELRADRDRLKAEYAMQGRRLQLRLDDLKTRMAEQMAFTTDLPSTFREHVPLSTLTEALANLHSMSWLRSARRKPMHTRVSMGADAQPGLAPQAFRSPLAHVLLHHILPQRLQAHGRVHRTRKLHEDQAFELLPLPVRLVHVTGLNQLADPLGRRCEGVLLEPPHDHCARLWRHRPG